MTIVAIWFEPDDRAVWCAADTRISAEGATGGQTIRTDQGSKIFLLPVKCSTPRTGPSLTSVVLFRSTWGMAFAGDVLPAISTYAVASNFLQNLVYQNGDPQAPVSIADAANLCARLGREYMRSYLASTNGQRGTFEAAIFGWCPVAAGFRVAHLERESDKPGVDVAVTITDPVGSSKPLILGQRVEYEEEAARFEMHGDPYGRRGRAPLHILEAIVARGVASVGGDISLAHANQTDVQLFGRATPDVVGEPKASLSFNGIQLSGESAYVGTNLIGVNFLA
ncbi:hypothetical protein LJR090_003572 [Bosea sp. LjRoot90]|uniref:hypothetical protein n=1 Tax=Bosea sp. LjRoot90 TaxID=3342342 RepID=UPI003ECF8C72